MIDVPKPAVPSAAVAKRRLKSFAPFVLLLAYPQVLTSLSDRS